MNRITRRGVLALGVTGLVSLAGCLGGVRFDSEASESVEREFDAAAVDSITVVNPVGDITVVAEDVDSVRTRIVTRGPSTEVLEAVEVRTDLVDGALTVETTLPKLTARTRQSAAATIRVTVPEDDTAPTVDAVAADVGSISLSGTRGDTVVRTDVGDVSATRVDGYLSLESNVGSVTASEVAGLDRATTEVGDLKVELLNLRRDVDVGSDIGDVVVGVAAGLDLDILAESQGTVNSDLPLVDSEVTRRRLTGRLNNGGHRVRAYSDVGDVSLRARV